MEKRRKYERRVLDVEHSSFTPLVFSPRVEAGTFLSQSHSEGFSLIDSAVMYLHGARSSIHNPSRDLNLHSQPLDLIANEARWSV